MSAEIDVRALGARTFRVPVPDRALETTHEVAVPERLHGGPDLGGEDLARVVRASFLFLLGRGPASSILARFSLDDISRYYPEYPRELARRLG